MVISRNILDIPDIAESVKQWQPGLEVYLREMFRYPYTVILTDEDYSIVLIVEGMTYHVGIMHIFVHKQARGKQLLKFIEEAKAWGRENTRFKYMFNWTDDRKVKMLMHYFGAKKVGEVNGKIAYRTEV